MRARDLNRQVMTRNRVRIVLMKASDLIHLDRSLFLRSHLGIGNLNPLKSFERMNKTPE
jgi:hypothetical protein